MKPNFAYKTVAETESDIQRQTSTNLRMTSPDATGEIKRDAASAPSAKSRSKSLTKARGITARGHPPHSGKTPSLANPWGQAKPKRSSTKKKDSNQVVRPLGKASRLGVRGLG